MHVSVGGSSCSDDFVSAWWDKSMVVTAAVGGLGGAFNSASSHTPDTSAARLSEERESSSEFLPMAAGI